MSDNTELNPGTGGDVSRSKDRTGVKTQIVALDLNPSGAESLMGGKMPITAADGDSAALGATTDADTASTVIGRLKKLVSLLPAALGAQGALKVEGVASGTAQPVSGTVTAANAAGDVAHDASDSGNPVKMGGRAISDLAGATMVSAGDRADMMSDIDGVQLSRPMCPLGNILVERVSNTDGNSTALSTFGATANAKNHITTLIVYNDSTTNGFVDLRDGTAGSVIATIPLPAKGGAVISFPVPLRQPTANTALAFDVSAALTTVYLTFVGFKSKA